MRIPILSNSYKGISSDVTSETRINCYAEIGPDGKTVQRIYGTPGCVEFADLGAQPVRGMHAFGDFMYAVSSDQFYQINNAGTATAKGTLNTISGNVSIRDNGTQIIIVDGTDGWIYTPASDTFAQISDGDFPTANTADFIGGYFVVDSNNTGRYYISSLYDGTAWDALDFKTAESSPDNLIRVKESHGQLFLFGDETIEVHVQTENADFPFTRLAGANIKWGLAARWSVADFNGTLAFLAKRSDGALQVVVMNGYMPQRISSNGIEKIIKDFSRVSDAVAFSYAVAGHYFYNISFPSEGRSFEFDASTGLWHERMTGDDRYLGEKHVFYLNRQFVGGHASGKIYRVDEATYTDADEQITRQFVMPYAHADGQAMFYDRLWIEFEEGVGLTSGQGIDPMVWMDWSDDGGKVYGNPIVSRIGALGEYNNRAVFDQLGYGYQRDYRITMSDPVKFVVVGAILEADVGYR